MPAWLTLVAGANGAGKSTLTSALPFHAALNPDVFAQHLQLGGVPTGYADLLAVQLVEQAVATAIRGGFSIVVETVLSTPKYRRHVTDAHAAGMAFGLVYIALSSADLAVARVWERVQAGGHDVPEAKIRSRWQRSLDNFGWFAERADKLLVFLNDTRAPELLAWGDQQGITLAPDALARHGKTPIVGRLLKLPNLRRTP